MDNTTVIDALADGLTNGGFKTSRTAVGDQQALVAPRSEFRWEWVGSRMHTFVVVFSVGALGSKQAQALSTEAQAYAIKHKGGLPRGLQTGTATIAVVIPDEVDEDPAIPTGSRAGAAPTTARSSPSPSVRWFRQEPKHRYAALLFPVLARLRREELVYFTGRWSRGYLYRDYLLSIVRDIIAPALDGAH